MLSFCHTCHRLVFGGRVGGMKQTLLTICLILFAFPIWGETTFSGGNISGGKIGSTDTEGSWA